MGHHSSVGRLHISRVNTTCLFSLSWQQGNQLTAQLKQPERLQQHYQAWQDAYLAYYGSLHLRGRVGHTGAISAPVHGDRHKRLVRAETQLLNTFLHWLCQRELFYLRKQLSQFHQICLSCDSLDLAKLPWEQWELTSNNGSDVVQIVRTSALMRTVANGENCRRIRPRVLVVWGDNAGLDLRQDVQTIARYQKRFDITSLQFEPSDSELVVKERLAGAIADPRGWDMLFFFGHSGESPLVGGDLQILPNLGLSIRDLSHCLKAAHANGLQFALFNSCSGLDIADALIKQGIQQCVVMRERIHNHVAQIFLDIFLQCLSDGYDVQQSMEQVCQELQTSHGLTYPSAFLVPSLFHSPNQPFFKLRPSAWKSQLQTLSLQPLQSVLLISLLCISLLPNVQSFLLSNRLLAQGLYRNVTKQLPAAPPPVTLISVDQPSLSGAKIVPNADGGSDLFRNYFTELLEQLPPELKAAGIDFAFPYSGELSASESANKLGQAFQATVEQRSTWLVLPYELSDTDGEDIIYDLSNSTLYGYSDAPPQHLARPWNNPVCQEDCPFNYLLALAYRIEQTPNQIREAADSTNSKDFRNALMQAAYSNTNPAVRQLLNVRLSVFENWVMGVSYYELGLPQFWLQPIFDFSLPPDRVFKVISAQELLSAESSVSIDPETVVMIVPGGYQAADDDFPLPSAVAYGRRISQDIGHYASLRVLTGGEKNAYAVHHFLRQHLVRSVPDIWLVGVAVILGYGSYRLGRDLMLKRERVALILIAGSLLYGAIALQVFITLQVVLPWFLPCLVPWIYWLPSLRKSRK